LVTEPPPTTNRGTSGMGFITTRDGVEIFYPGDKERFNRDLLDFIKS
jgi:hypothetical protein